jgi:hypothetical protein
MTMQEQFIDGAVNTAKPKGWRTGTFQTQTALQPNSFIFFGMYAELCFRTAFDYYGGDCYRYYFEDFIEDGIPDVMEQGEFLEEDDFGRLLSMYFEYSLNQNYVVHITEGISFTDTIDVRPCIRRIISSIAHNTTTLKRSCNYIRNIITEIITHSEVIRPLNIIGKILTTVFAHDYIFTRFLVSKDEIVLKSAITRELVLESRIR